MELKDLKRDLDTLGTAWEEFKTSNDQRIADAIKGSGIAELSEKLDKINTAMDEIVEKRDSAVRESKVLTDRVAELEATLDAISVEDGRKFRKELQEYESVFNDYLRSFVTTGKTGDPDLANQLVKLAAEIPELKAVQTTTGAAGGVAVPEQISRQVNDQVRLISPIRDLVKYVVVGTSDYKELVNIHGEASAWAAEAAARSETATSSFRERAPTSGTLYAYPRASEEALMDIFFDVGAMLVQVTGDEFAIQEETAFLSGNGTARPTGITNTAPVTTDDDASPARSAEALEYVPLDTSSPLSAIDPDQLLTMIYLLRRPYRMRATWIMNSPTTGTVRKLKDGQSQYLWAPGLQAGEPDRLLGFPHQTLEGMDDVASTNFPIGFGDFKRGYLMIQIAGMRITVDDNITTPGFVKWYIRQRIGGIILDNNAIKLGRYATS